MIADGSAPGSSPSRSDAILDAARQVFAREGFAGATIDAVAKAAGIAKGTVYLYFRSKEELYWEALRQRLSEVQTRSDRAMAEVESTAEKIRAFIAVRLDYFEAERDFFRVYFAELGHSLVRAAGPDDKLEELYIGQARKLRAMLDEGVERGELRAQRTDATAYAILDLTRACLVQRLRGWSHNSAEEDLEHLCTLLWKGISK
jgi:AcrR family transcriptional regulator